jgi:ABC-type transport system involved in multi-copper enzyme maturation permease subunit
VGVWSRLTRPLREPNAIWMREMRQSARLARTPWILFSLVLALTLLLSTIGGVAASNTTSPADLGGALFQTFFAMAYFVVVLVGPAVAANGIAAEREGRTWEAVLLTGMAPKEIARGKFLAAYTTVALYLVALAPIGALSFLFGGVTAGEVVIAFALLFLLAALAVAFGLAVSSLMSNLRGAIVVTLMLAVGVGPSLFSIGGFAGSFAAHKAWHDIPEGLPIWLPMAYERAPFGLDYVVLLVVFPLLLVAIPAWFLYESTVANLTGEADDRSSGLKRWFACSSPVLAITLATPSLLATDPDAKTGLAVAGLVVYAMHIVLCALLFTSEPPGPSRRIVVRWDRTGVGVLRRFFGPGLARTMTLVVLMCVLGVVIIGGLGGVSSATVGARHTDEVAVVAAYVAPFCVFAIGLVALLRARSSSAWIARIVAGGVLFLIGVLPWVAAAVTGLLSDSSPKAWTAIAAPSPFFLVPMLDELTSYAHAAPMIVPTGLTFAYGWGFLGFVMLGVAKRKSDRILRERDDILRKADLALDAEVRVPAHAADPTP